MKNHRILSYDPSKWMALGRETRWNRFQVILTKIYPHLGPKTPFLGPNGPKIKIMQIVSYDPSFFMFRARKSRKKIFSGHFDQIGPNFGPKKGEKRWILVKILKKNFFFKSFIFLNWAILSRKKVKKWWKKFFLCKMIWLLVIFGQKTSFSDFERCQNSIISWTF